MEYGPSGEPRAWLLDGNWLLPRGAAATEVLDAVRARADVTDFGVEAPSLSQLFLSATGHRADQTPETPETSEVAS